MSVSLVPADVFLIMPRLVYRSRDSIRTERVEANINSFVAASISLEVLRFLHAFAFALAFPSAALTLTLLRSATVRYDKVQFNI